MKKHPADPIPPVRPPKKALVRSADPAARPNPIRVFERRLGHRFRDPSLLDTALTHPSHRFENPGVPADNQRLEFLGDAVLAMAAADRLYREQPDFHEGQLTEARSRWIRTSTLAGIGRALNLGSLLKLGRGETLTGGADRNRTLEDALEAVLGAVFLDGGWSAARHVFDRVFAPGISDAGSGTRAHNPKGVLQEICQARWKKSPEYRTIEESGLSHQKQFSVEVRLEDRVWGRGTGSSRRAAQTEAAERALEQLEREKG